MIHEAIETTGKYTKIEIAVLEYDMYRYYTPDVEPAHALADFEIDQRDDVVSKASLWVTCDWDFVAFQPYIGTLSERNFEVFQMHYCNFAAYVNRKAELNHKYPRLTTLFHIAKLLSEESTTFSEWDTFVIRDGLRNEESSGKPLIGNKTRREVELRLEKVEKAARQWQAERNAELDYKYVYVMKAGTYYKIGVSLYPERRRSELNTGTPFEVELIASAKRADAHGVEKSLHKKLAAYRKSGEWFELPESTAEQLLSELTDKKEMII